MHFYDNISKEYKYFLSQIIDSNTERIYEKPVLFINATETATYECSAENIHIGGVTVAEKLAKITVIRE